MTFHKNSSSGSKVLPCWQTDGHTDMTKLIGGFRSRKIVKSAWNLCLSEYYIKHKCILCLWFRASLFYINNCPKRCNTKQSIYYSACFGCQTHPSSGIHKTVTTASGTSHIFCASTSLQRGQAWQRWREAAAQYSWWWVWLTPETCRVNLQNNK